jgi:hypothetical protein
MKIYARFSFHREKIIAMESLYSKTHKSYLMVTMCIENKIKVYNILIKFNIFILNFLKKRLSNLVLLELNS